MPNSDNIQYDTIVKVQKPIGRSLDMWLVYDERRENICHLLELSIPKIVRLHMTHSHKEFFRAKWDKTINSWIIGPITDWHDW